MDTRTREAVRYLGYGNHAVDDHTLAMICGCLKELEQTAGERIVCRIFDLKPGEEPDCLDIGDMHIKSKNLYKNTKGCEKALLLGATLGTEVDKQIRTYSLTDMAKAVVMQACASAYLEEYLEEWQEKKAAEIETEGLYLRPRFSPGYGDFSIGHQTELLRMLDAAKKIGLTMTAGSMLTPSKSVTAVIGLSRRSVPCHKKGCEACGKSDCIYRR